MIPSTPQRCFYTVHNKYTAPDQSLRLVQKYRIHVQGQGQCQKYSDYHGQHLKVSVFFVITDMKCFTLHASRFASLITSPALRSYKVNGHATKSVASRRKRRRDATLFDLRRDAARARDTLWCELDVTREQRRSARRIWCEPSQI